MKFSAFGVFVFAAVFGLSSAISTEEWKEVHSSLTDSNNNESKQKSLNRKPPVSVPAPSLYNKPPVSVPAPSLYNKPPVSVPAPSLRSSDFMPELTNVEGKKNIFGFDEEKKESKQAWLRKHKKVEPMAFLYKHGGEKGKLFDNDKDKDKDKEIWKKTVA